MMRNDDAVAQQVEQVMPRVSLGGIILFTTLGIVLASVLSPDMPSFNKMLIVVSTFGVVSANLVVLRLVVLPSMASGQEAGRANLFIAGYSSAVLPATTGAVASGFTGYLFVPPVYGAIALISWAAVWMFLRGLPEAQR